MIRSLLPRPDRSEDSLFLSLEALEDRTMLSSVQIFAARSAGGEQIELVINDQVVETFTIENAGSQLTQFDFQASQPLSAIRLLRQTTASMRFF